MFRDRVCCRSSIASSHSSFQTHTIRHYSAYSCSMCVRLFVLSFRVTSSQHGMGWVALNVRYTKRMRSHSCLPHDFTTKQHLRTRQKNTTDTRLASARFRFIGSRVVRLSPYFIPTSSSSSSLSLFRSVASSRFALIVFLSQKNDGSNREDAHPAPRKLLNTV